MVSQGHKILARNWKSRYCEIDIVSYKDGEYFLTEVKYRRNKKTSDGLDAIDVRKFRQLKFAANYLMSVKNIDAPVRLLAASVSGDNYVIDGIIELE